MNPKFILRVMLAAMSVLVLSACSSDQVQLPINLPGMPTATALPPNTLAYDAPVSLMVKVGAVLPGTAIAYNGKSGTGQAQVLIAGQLAPKQAADSVDWQGAPAANVTLKLATRVATFDEKSLTLVGSSHIEIRNVAIQPGGAPGNTIMELNAPVTFSLSLKETIPGTNVSYVAGTPEGAQFSGIEGYAYRKQLDSLQYSGRLNPKVYVKFDLRVLNYSEAVAVVGGTAKISIEQ